MLGPSGEAAIACPAKRAAVRALTEARDEAWQVCLDVIEIIAGAEDFKEIIVNAISQNRIRPDTAKVMKIVGHYDIPTIP
jgi:hypothetical protein